MGSNQTGGAGGKFFETILSVEELSRVDASAGVLVDVQNTLVSNALLRWGSAEQKQRYLPRMTLETVGSYALSEAGSGSDAFALQTRADLHGDDYFLNGRKLFVWSAEIASVPRCYVGNMPGKVEGIIPGVGVNVLTQGRVAESLHSVQELFNAAEASGDSALLISAHMAATGTRFWSGELVAAREHGNALRARDRGVVRTDALRATKLS